MLQLTLTVPLPPAYIGRELKGATAGLTDLLNRFHPGIGGALIAYARPRFATTETTGRGNGDNSVLYARRSGIATLVPLGRICDELPFVHTRVTVDALLFRPVLGQLLTGTVTSASTGHIGVLVAGLFNATLFDGDMSDGYIYDETREAWVALSPKDDDAQQVSTAVSGNPTALLPGTVVTFRVTRIAHSGGIVQLFGSLSRGDGEDANSLERRAAEVDEVTEAAAQPDFAVAAATVATKKRRRRGSAIEPQGSLDAAADAHAAVSGEKRGKKARALVAELNAS